MTNPTGRLPGDRRIFTYLQNAYARKTHWLTPLPWKPNFKFLFDQSYMKDIKFKHAVQYDSLSKEGETLNAGNNFTYSLLNMLSQLDLRLATIEGNLGSGKTSLIYRFLKDWVRVSTKLKNSGKVFLHCDLTNIDVENMKPKLDLNSVMDLFGLPGYLYDDFMWLIEKNSDKIIVLIETHNIRASSRLVFKLFYKVFPTGKFVIFHRPDKTNSYLDVPISQEYRYLLRRRVKLKIQNYDIRQTVNLVKQISSNSIMFQNFRDALYEYLSLSRLCSNPFILMVVLNIYKETKSIKFLENRLSLLRKILTAVWRRYANTTDQYDADIIQHIDSLLISFSDVAIETYTTNCHLSEDVISENEHSILLLDSGLLIEHRLPTKNTDSIERVYTFFDPLLHEYTCALKYSRQITEQPDTIEEIGNTLFSPEWKDVCLLVAGLLGKHFSILIKEINFDYMEDSALHILSDALNQCQCPRLCLRDVDHIPVPQSIDFSEMPITASTLKGLQTLLDWSHESQNVENQNGGYQSKRDSWNTKQINIQKTALERFMMKHQSRQDLNDNKLYSSSNTMNYDIRNNKSSCHNMSIPLKQQQSESSTSWYNRYSSCPDFNHAFGSLLTLNTSFDVDDSGEDLLIEQSWGSHYQAHLNKQKSIANLNSLGTLRQNQSLPSRTNSFTGSLYQQNESVLGSSYSLYSSLDSLLNGGEKKNDYIKDLRLKGSCIGNRTYASLVTFLEDNHLERLFLMDQHEENHSNAPLSISSKLVNKFLEAISESLTELTLNSNLLGSHWIDHLVAMIVENSNISYLSVAVTDLEQLNVENALKLTKAFQRNTALQQFELFCGVQSIVVQTSLGFFVDILERDSRISVVFL